MTNITKFPDPSNVTGFGDLLPYINTVQNDTFGLLLVLAIFIIAFIAMKSSSTTGRALAGSSVVSFLVALICFIAGILSITALIIFGVAAMIAYFAVGRENIQ